MLAGPDFPVLEEEAEKLLMVGSSILRSFMHFSEPLHRSFFITP
jgi:hypothetical protein